MKATDRNQADGVSANSASEAWLSGSPLWLVPAERNRAAAGYPLHLAPMEARIVAIGAHNFLPITAATWISDRNEINVGVTGGQAQAGRSLFIRIWTRDSRAVSRTVCFYAQGDNAVAAAEMGTWDGLPVAGIVLLSSFSPEADS